LLETDCLIVCAKEKLSRYLQNTLVPVV